MLYRNKKCRRLHPAKYIEDQIIRKTIFERDNFTCKNCNIKPNKIPNNYSGRHTVYINPIHLKFGSYLIVDHVIPWKFGGTIELSNLQTLCGSCNSSKGNRLLNG